jgi:imidazolonepropionase-like amidohydrolase
LPDGNDEVINNALFRVAISSSAGANGIRVNRVHPDKPAPATLDDRLVIARLLLESEREVHAIARGWSMAPTIPSGATLRIERATADSLVVGDVIAFAVNETLVTHRIISIGKRGRARNYLLTRGDGNTLSDPPCPVQAVLGKVTAIRVGEWSAVGSPIRRPGWRGTVAGAFDATMRRSLDLHVQLAHVLAHSAKRLARMWWRLQRITARSSAFAAGLLLLLMPNPGLSQQNIAFVGINVVPMDSERVLQSQTVMIENGRITSLHPAGNQAIPPGTRIIDGTGKYLMPGLSDMHVHLMRDTTELLLYLAHGVTTIRELAGEPMYLGWRERIATGKLVGPRLYVASPFIDAPTGKRAMAWFGGGTFAIATAICFPLWLTRRRISSARKRRALLPIAFAAATVFAFWLMRTVVPFPDVFMPSGATARLWVGSTRESMQTVRHAAEQYDQIKLYDGGLSPREFDAATRAARAAGIHTVGHAPPAIGLQHAFTAGLDELAHIYFIVQDLQSSNASASSDGRATSYQRRLKQLAAEMRERGVQVTSTLAPLPEMRQRLTDSTSFFAREESKYRTRAALQTFRDQIVAGMNATALADLQDHINWGGVVAAELTRSGVILALGTDASPIDVLAGRSAHDELEQLVASGLSPYQALRTATVNASVVVDATDEWGTVSAGKLADLLIVDQNPLETIGTLRHPFGVVSAGHWYDRRSLDGFLTTVVQRRYGS